MCSYVCRIRRSGRGAGLQGGEGGLFSFERGGVLMNCMAIDPRVSLPCRDGRTFGFHQTDRHCLYQGWYCLICGVLRQAGEGGGWGV